MIHYLVTGDGDHTFRNSAILDDPRLADRFEIVPYGAAFGRRTWRGGSVVFSDIDRLGYGSAMRAAALFLCLHKARGPIRFLNHPTRSCRRYAQLRRLHEAGINPHNVWRADERQRPDRFPVFIRRDAQHDGPLTPLLQDHESVEREIERLADFGFLPQDLLIVEFCDTGDADGVYRKCTAYLIGDTIFQRYMCFGDDWLVKGPRSGTVGERRTERSMLDEEAAYIGGDAYLPLLRRAASLCHLSFGRIDFGLLDGRPVIWEINSNPDPAATRYTGLGDRERLIVPTGWRLLRDALAALDDDAAHRTTVTVEPAPPVDSWYRAVQKQMRPPAV
jgi:hypothetical protein